MKRYIENIIVTLSVDTKQRLVELAKVNDISLSDLMRRITGTIGMRGE